MRYRLHLSFEFIVVLCLVWLWQNKTKNRDTSRLKSKFISILYYSFCFYHNAMSDIFFRSINLLLQWVKNTSSDGKLSAMANTYCVGGVDAVRGPDAVGGGGAVRTTTRMGVAEAAWYATGNTGRGNLLSSLVSPGFDSNMALFNIQKFGAPHDLQEASVAASKQQQRISLLMGKKVLIV